MQWHHLLKVDVEIASNLPLSHLEAVVQRLLTLLFQSVSVTIVSERLDDVVRVKFARVSLPKQRLDNRLRLFQEVLCCKSVGQCEASSRP